MFNQLVWMIEERVTAEVINYGAYSSRVKFTQDGIEYDEIVMNEDFIILSELGFDYGSIDE